MRPIEPLLHGKYYHIYNRGINGCDLFTEKSNFEYFLNLYDKYLTPVADTSAWVLMKNHFHFLVKIREEDRTLLGVSKALSGVPNPERADKKPLSSRQFSHLFNAYAQAFNKLNHRTGSLFEHPFKRKLIEDTEYFKAVVVYIHNNPVHHGFTQHAMDYPWSSYLTCVSVKPTHIQREAVIGWFNSMAEFKTLHKPYQNQTLSVVSYPERVKEDLDKWLGL
jgi:putative transposase